MEKRIIINNGDGTVGILIPSPKLKLTIEEIIEKDIPTGSQYRIIDKSEVPSDRVFRNAWTDDNSTDTIDVDISRAKEIAHNIRRKHRDEVMGPLDRKATIPSEVAEVEIEREKIRNQNAKIQISIDKSKTPDELKNSIKGILK